MGFVLIVAFIFILGFMGKRVSSKSYFAVALVALSATFLIFR
jgi:hypothetical protein